MSKWSTAINANTIDALERALSDVEKLFEIAKKLDEAENALSDEMQTHLCNIRAKLSASRQTIKAFESA